MTVKVVKFELNSKGVVELMKSPAMQNVLKQYGEATASAAGKGYSTDIVMSGDRAKAFVEASTLEAKRDNKKNNTLLKALGGGR